MSGFSPAVCALCGGQPALPPDRVLWNRNVGFLAGRLRCGRRCRPFWSVTGAARHQPNTFADGVGFSLAVLAGLGWDRFHRSENRRLKFWWWQASGAPSVCAAMVLAPGGPGWSRLDAAHRSFLKPQFLMLAGSLVASGALFLRTLNRQNGLGSVIVLGWVAVDLLVFGMGYNPQLHATVTIHHAGHSMAETAGPRRLQGFRRKISAGSQHG